MSQTPFRALYTAEARKNIEKLDPSIQKVVRRAIESLALNPAKGKPLAYDLAGLHSLRTSDYRIVYRIKDKELVIIVVTVGRRREIYKRLRQLLKFPE